MKPQPVELTETIALPSPKPNAFMDLDDRANRSREEHINMNNREQVRQDRATAATVSKQLVALEKMTVGELAEKYREVFGVPTRTRNKPYLRKRVAWRIQELAEGGLSPRALAKIEELAPLAPVRWLPERTSGDAAALASMPIQVRPRDPRLPAVGSAVVRVHQGVEHRVTVLDDGFEYQGRRHTSLSEIARLISGTRWNGYLFFGLQRRPGTSQAAEVRV
jgi:hypothetical protein